MVGPALACMTPWCGADVMVGGPGLASGGWGVPAGGNASALSDGGQRGDPTSAIRDGSVVSLGLRMATQGGEAQFINSGGDVGVPRGELTSIGASTISGSEIFAFWDEFVGESSNQVVVTWFSLDFSTLLPPGQQIGGDAADFMDWRVGALDPIDFRDAVVENVQITRATLFFESQTGQPTVDFSFTLQLQGPWDGTDVDLRQLIPGDGYDVLTMQYEFTFDVVPAPVGILPALGGLIVLRRPRRR